MFASTEYEILNTNTLRRTLKDFPSEEAAINHVSDINRKGYGKFELYNQMGHRVVRRATCH